MLRPFVSKGSSTNRGLRGQRRHCSELTFAIVNPATLPRIADHP